jgi:hypothetical protein
MPVLLTRHWKLAILWALSLFAVGTISSSAQAQRQPGSPFGFLTQNPTVISGNDIGFRIERNDDGIPSGRLVIRVDGRWIDTGLATPAVPAR